MKYLVVYYMHGECIDFKNKKINAAFLFLINIFDQIYSYLQQSR